MGMTADASDGGWGEEASAAGRYTPWVSTLKDILQDTSMLGNCQPRKKCFILVNPAAFSHKTKSVKSDFKQTKSIFDTKDFKIDTLDWHTICGQTQCPVSIQKRGATLTTRQRKENMDTQSRLWLPLQMNNQKPGRVQPYRPTRFLHP